jgi:hypothetical protein
MAAHIETGTMASSEHYSSKLLKHLGLVVGMYDELCKSGDTKSANLVQIQIWGHNT